MECRYVQSRFTGYLDGDLRTADRILLEAHLEACADCRDEFETVRSFSEACRDAFTYSGPVYTFKQLRARMATIETLDEVIYFLPRLRVNGLIPRYAVAMLLAMILCGVPGALSHSHRVYAAIKEPVTTQVERIDTIIDGEMPAEMEGELAKSKPAASVTPA